MPCQRSPRYRYKSVPFGVQSKRFVNAGLHPSFDKRSYTIKYPNVSPGCYHAEKTNARPRGIGYARSLETEEFSRTLEHRADCQLREKLWLRSINGPGWHDPETPRIWKYPFNGARRFPRTTLAPATPGPGYYGKEHIPHLRLEEKSKAKAFSFSDTPSFEYDNCLPRTINVYRSYHLPPNLYKVKTSIEELVSKVVSKRGPYDLFTGARDESSIYGHFARRAGSGPSLRNAGTATVLERLRNPCNKFKGKFLRCGRETFPTMRQILTDPALCKPDPDRPGPSAYDPSYPPKPVNRSGFPFNSSLLHVRPVKKNELMAPPGRYDPFKGKRILGDGMKSAFLSTVKRGLPIPEKMSWF